MHEHDDEDDRRPHHHRFELAEAVDLGERTEAATADQTGTRVYEFQISDNTNFTAATTSNVPGFAATVSKTGVPEGSAGVFHARDAPRRAHRASTRA